jgi:hypothetical protein
MKKKSIKLAAWIALLSMLAGVISMIILPLLQ